MTNAEKMMLSDAIRTAIESEREVIKLKKEIDRLEAELKHAKLSLMCYIVFIFAICTTLYCCSMK